jgi:hypothetical protein
MPIIFSCKWEKDVMGGWDLCICVVRDAKYSTELDLCVNGRILREKVGIWLYALYSGGGGLVVTVGGCSVDPITIIELASNSGTTTPPDLSTQHKHHTLILNIITQALALLPSFFAFSSFFLPRIIYITFLLLPSCRRK